VTITKFKVKTKTNLDRPCGVLSNVFGTAVKDELILLNNELVDPNIVVAFNPAAIEFLYFASAPGAADNTRGFTKPPNCKGAVGGGVRLPPANGLGLLPIL